MSLFRVLLTLFLLAGVAAADTYRTEPAGPPPPEAAALAPALAPEGVKVLRPDGNILCEFWFAREVGPEGTPEQNATWGIAHGTFLGVVRVHSRWSDRRGQPIRPGVYTLRISFFPMNGDHQGVAPQRDFAILSPADIDRDAAAKPSFDALMDMSRKASRTPHPLVLSLWKESGPVETGITAEGESDQVLRTTIGGTPVALIVYGRSDH
ncbi:MAG: hypothetical protein N2036_15630 [Bryobacteraceae bacterium]|nr:hypothetical protein [Bryobacteraceae bacterium]MCX7605504.1 hypothetical protein [Bryobacteraceae bacterium]